MQQYCRNAIMIVDKTNYRDSFLFEGNMKK